ncbi:TetR/AcrR family transcriptional regulator [Actinoplanes bogorensis]|uniref:TetR/AcrR family transcriptional regulator n=1 Tax=Paractinoplanes bogorensis TaxID=1610840 RepID=A0ABS5YQV7_9ACTN|nr:TetR/AcrR family transcriptional regulator [Actinoplanes bogorensis]MBU2665716.1 TetR/AcrR family transcriptional regulator [Actinoplanes bogorensis]
MTSTADRLVVAAAELLDNGGEAAVTLRAVGAAIGVSHNAPYKHFAARDDLLAGVAAADFRTIAESFRQVRGSEPEPIECLLAALDVVVRFSQDHPARYRLLFNNPAIAATAGPLSSAAEEALSEFAAIVGDGQAAGALPATPTDHLAILIFATAHGLIDSDASGRLRPRTGWADLGDGLRTLIGLLAKPQ